MSDVQYLTEVASGAMLVGFLGSPHCFAMCGGIAGALAQAGKQENSSRFASFVVQLCYNIGRIGSYALAGALVGSIGFLLSNWLGLVGRIALRGLAGVFLIALGFSVAGWWSGLQKIELLGSRFWKIIAPWVGRLRPVDSLVKALLLGGLWGWLPCGLVYSVLATAGSSGNAGAGALCMASFGVGTLPAVLATGQAAHLVTVAVRRHGVRQAAGALLLGFGLWTLFGAWPMLQSGAHCAH